MMTQAIGQVHQEEEQSRHADQGRFASPEESWRNQSQGWHLPLSRKGALDQTPDSEPKVLQRQCLLVLRLAQSVHAAVQQVALRQAVFVNLAIRDTLIQARTAMSFLDRIWA